MQKDAEPNFYGDRTPWTTENMVAIGQEVSLMMRKQGRGNVLVTMTPKAKINKQGEVSYGIAVEKF